VNYLSGYYTRIQTDATQGFQLYSVCRQGVTFLVAILLAKSALSLPDIGTYEIWMYLGMILSFLGLSGIFQAFLVFYPRYDAAQQKSFVFTVFMLIWILTGLLAILLYIFRTDFFGTLLGIEVISDLLLVLLFLCFHFIAVFAPYIFLAGKRPAFFIPYTVFYIAGTVLSVVVPLLFTTELRHLLQGLFIWSIIEHLLLLVIVFRFSDNRISLSFIRPFLRAAVPLTIYAGSGLFAQIFDAWLVSHTFEDLAVFAIFKYGARELPGAVALAAAFSASMAGLYATEHGNSLARIKEGSRRFMLIFFPLAFVLLFISKPVFGWIYNDAFQESAVIFNTYLLLMLSRWIFPQAVLIGSGRNREVLWISLTELVINIMASLILVKYLGLTGIALGTVIAFLSEKMMMILLLRRKYGIPLSQYLPMKPYLAFSSLLITGYVCALII
jgi:O-antigen/teichoic acid export membrane protein